MQTGHLGDNPIMRGADNNVASFSVATSKKWTTKLGEKKQETVWLNWVAFGRQAETVNQYLKKGSKVLLEGEPMNNDYTNKDGVLVKQMAFRVFSVEFLDNKGDNQSDASGGNSTAATGDKKDNFSDMDDVPF